MSNKWSGKFIDATGQQGTIEVETGSGQDKRASWTIYLAVPHGEPHVLRGVFDAEVDENQMQVKGEGSFEKDQKLQWDIALNSEKASTFAKSAMIGRYTVRSSSPGEPGFPLTSGVLVLWQFAE